MTSLTASPEESSSPFAPIKVSARDPRMTYAISFARRSLPHALNALEQGAIRSLDVKAPIATGGSFEHIWVRGVVHQGGYLTGIIDNDAEGENLPKCGEVYSVSKAKISDWHYLEGNRMHGAFTLRVLLDQMPPEHAARLRQMLVPFEGFEYQ